MAVNYMDRLAALRGDHQHAAGGRISAPVLHADEEKKKSRRKKKLSRKQKAALAKGRKIMAAKRRAAKRGAKPKRVTRGRKAVARRKAQLARKRAAPKRVTRGRKAVARRKAERRIEQMTPQQRKAHYLALLGTGRRKKKRAAPKRTAMAKKTKKKHGGRKSPKRVAAGKKAARTRKRHKAERAAARRRGGHKKRGGHARGRKRGAHKRRAAPRRRKRGGHARRRTRGTIRRKNRGPHGGQFVGRGGRIHGRKVRGGYHKAGRIVREDYSMENPLGMSELATGLATGLVGYLAADLTDRYLAGSRPPLAGTLYAEASPIYSDYVRLGVGLMMAVVPLAGAHFLDGNKHAHIRAGLQFFGFGAGLRTLGHLASDLIAKLKNNTMVGSTVQALYPHEIVSQAQLAAIQKTGAGALPEHIGAQVAGMGGIPQGLAACCSASSRMLNPALSVLQPIGRSAEGGGAAANYAPPPVALPPPIERIVQQPYAPPQDGTRQAMPIPIAPPVMAAPLPARAATPASTPAATMAAAYALPVAAPAGGAAAFGPAGLPASPFDWGNNDSPN